MLKALAAAPGTTSAAVAKAAGISPSVAAATISRLVKQGRMRRLDEGGYVVVEGPTDDRGQAPASAAGANEAAANRPKGAEASGGQPPPATAE